MPDPKASLDAGSKSSLDAKMEAQKIAFAPIMFQAALLLRNSGVLALLDARGADGATPEVIAEAVQMSEYGAKVLLDAGMSAGVVRAVDDRFVITKVGYFLLKDELTRVNMDFTQDVCYRGMFHLDEAIQTGTPAGLRVFGDWPTIYAGLAQLPQDVQRSWFAFDHFYSDGAFPKVLPLVFDRHPKKLLDIGGNTGKFSLACADYDPDVYVTILDHPGQLVKARDAIAARGMQGRIDTAAIDLLDMTKPYPTGYDVLWMSQFLCCFSLEEITGLCRRAKDAMGPDSRLFVLDTFPDRQRYDISTYCLNATSLYFTALANGNSRMYRSADMLRAIEAAGLTVVAQTDHLAISHTLLECAVA